MEKKKALSLLCAGIFSLSLTAPVLDFMPADTQNVAEAAKSYICSKCQRTTTTQLGSPSPGNCPKGGTHNWIYRGGNDSPNIHTNGSDGFPATSHGYGTANSESWWNLRPNPETVMRVRGNKPKNKAENTSVHIKNKGKYNVRVRLATGFFKPAQNYMNPSYFVLKPGEKRIYMVKPGNGTSDIYITKDGSKTSVVDVTIESKKKDGFKLDKVK